LKKLIDYINTNVLVKITSLQGASVITRIIAGILTSKAIAIFIGPTGLALIGNLQNFVSSFQNIAILGFYNGAVKYISDFKDDAVALSKTISTLFYVGFTATILVSFLC
jgi:O-antigen/teichoic acid export membrane protein